MKAVSFFSLLILLISFSCNIKRRHTINKSIPTSTSTLLLREDTTLENKALDSLFTFPEVQRLSKIIDSESQLKTSLSMITTHKPEKQKPYYIIQVGYNNNLRFQPFYNFYIYPENFEIKYFNPIKDTLLSLDEWRKQEK